jgi:hypothetical protein
MKDAYELLRTKELETENLRIEIEALRIAAPILSDSLETPIGSTVLLGNTVQNGLCQ